MLEKIIKVAEKSEQDLTFEIGSNSDLILENTITQNLVWTIDNFKNTKKGKLTFPTKFDMVDDILNLDHQGKVIVRMSVNPEEIINKVEFGTSRLKGRIEAINKLKSAGYKVRNFNCSSNICRKLARSILGSYKKSTRKFIKRSKKRCFF